MKYINSRSEGAGAIGQGLFQRWVGCVLGLVLFFSAGASVALAQSGAMTQSQYLQWMANVCGDRLPSSATAADHANWARGKGMNPTGGWQLNAKLTKQVVAQTLVQLLNLAPRKGNFDAVRILEREGIFISSSAGYVGVKQLVVLLDDGFSNRVNNGNGEENGNGRRGGDDDDDVLTPTKPGYGKGDKNHDHSGPPGHAGQRPGKGNQKHGR
jgi:hypothetical protein